jgi:hypothetical protein
MAAFRAHFGDERLMPMPLVTASEDIGNFGEAAGVPTVFWFWGGLDTQTVLSAMAEGRLDSLPGNHSPYFAPGRRPDDRRPGQEREHGNVVGAGTVSPAQGEARLGRRVNADAMTAGPYARGHRRAWSRRSSRKGGGDLS